MKKCIAFVCALLAASVVLSSCSGGEEPAPQDQKELEKNQANSPDIDSSKG